MKTNVKIALVIILFFLGLQLALNIVLLDFNSSLCSE